MKRTLLVLFCLLAFPLIASHIVGGEFEIIHISGNTYRINLIQYFDVLNGNPDAQDLNINARIFRKSDNFPMRVVALSFIKEEPVSYTQPECSNGEIVTKKITYSTTIQLPPSEFSHPGGYYIVWERCCRNYDLTNIFSQDPNVGGQYAGQTFYLEFPAVTKNGLPFINSSPRLFPPLNDYACPRRPYYVDFAGTDDDGDSLAYTIVTPLNTKSGDALPLPDFLPRPMPYPNVVYRSPYNINNILGGQPDLDISVDGFLTVTPTRLGLYVFAVRCEEFRDGVKIGEVRRDFQMLVVDGCPEAEPPKIKGKKLTDADFTYEGNMPVSFSASVTDEDRCIQVQVSDPDASKIQDGFQEKIKIRAIPLNFKRADMPDILPSITNATLVNGSVATFDICFDKCPPIEGPYQIAIVAFDDACSLPLSDTLRITVNQEPAPNAKPVFNLTQVTEVANEGATLSWDIIGTDADGDPLVVGAVVDGFNFSEAGMTLNTLEQSNGLYRSEFIWDTRCDVYDFSKKTNFTFTLLLEDVNLCKTTDADTLNFNLTVVLPGNADPVISTDLSPGEIQNGLTRKIFEKIEFNVMGDDQDLDTLDLLVRGIDFTPGDYGIETHNVTGIGHVQTPFRWDISCKNHNLGLKSEFEFEFVVIDDNNKCRVMKADTLLVTVKLQAPDNDKPDLQIINTNPELLFTNNEQSLKVGQQISLALVAKDDDRVPFTDLISIKMVEARGSVEPEGYVFAPAEGEGSAETTFVWNTDCSIFEEKVYENTYTFRFKTEDNRCLNPKADTVDVNFIISDIDAEEDEFIPPNFISPNADESNDFFAMLRINPQTLELESILPKDNCVGRFVGISIFNRWGTEIFQSNSRDFRWYPVREAPGIYFYTLQYSNRNYKGSITLRD
jgi:hypothetical protein